MRAFLLWRARLRDEGSYGIYDHLERVEGVIFDEEEARQVERAQCVAWARANGALFLRMERFSIEHDLHRKKDSVTSIDQLSDDEIMILYRHDDGRPFVAQEVDVDELVSLDGVGAAELAATLRALGGVLRAFDSHAGDALVADADAWESK